MLRITSASAGSMRAAPQTCHGPAPACRPRWHPHWQPPVLELALILIICLSMGWFVQLERMLICSSVQSGLGLGRDELNLAIESSDYDVVHALLERGVAVNAIDADGWTPLIRAATVGHVGISDMLIEHGADVNVNSEHVGTALCVSLLREPRVTELLLRRGADPNLTATPRRLPPLRIACLQAPIDTIRLLLDAGADVNGSGPDGFTPLMAASLADRADVVEALLRAGGDVAAVDDEGNTALHYAVETSGDVHDGEIIQILLFGGARAHVANRQGMTPLDIAREAHSDGAVHLLEVHS